MRIIFAGTPAIAVTPLRALLNAKHDIVAVYTQPDQPAGRGRVLTASPVKQFALEHHLPIEQPTNLKTVQLQQADIMVVMAYGLILPKTLLSMPRLGCVNIHVSLLPRWRGAAPVQQAILAGDKETGITLMQMDAGLDTGAILKQQACPILENDTAESLYARLDSLIAPLLSGLNEIEHVVPVPQDNTQASYAHKIMKADAKIDWTESAEIIVRKIRAYNPAPVAYVGEIRLWQAHVVTQHTSQLPGTIIAVTKTGIIMQAGQHAVCVTELQLAGKKRLPVSAIINAYQQRFAVGMIF